MKTYDNSGKLIGEITVAVRPGFGVIQTNTVYDAQTGRPISQNISTREFDGSVRTFDVLFGKLLP